VLLSLEFGKAQAYIKLIYAIVMIFTSGMNVIPIFDVSHNLRQALLEEQEERKELL